MEDYKHNPWVSIVAMSVDCILGVCEVPKSQEQSADKRLLCKCITPTSSSRPSVTAMTTQK